MFEAYAVAVRVSLKNGVAVGLMQMSRQFAKVHGDAKALQKTLDKIKLTGMIGGGALAVGGAGLWAIGKTIGPAKEYAHQLAQMNIAGMKHAEIQRSIAAAWKLNSSVPTMTSSGSLEMIRELRGVVGSTTEAINVLPSVARLQGVLSNVKGVTDAKGTAYDVAKLLDIRGASMDPERFKTEADMMLKAIVASGGTIDAKDFFGTGKLGRAATIGWSKEFMYELLPTLMQEMKGAGGGGSGGPGNPLMGAYDKVVNGVIAQKNLPLWDQLGLIDTKKAVWTKSGHMKGLLPGGVMGSDMFISNPFQWTQQVLMPAMRKAGINDPKRQQEYISRMFGTRTSSFAIQQMALQPLKFQRDKGLIKGAMGFAGYEELMKVDPIIAEAALKAQWTNLLAVLGFELMPALVGGALKLVKGLTAMSNWFRAHPNMTKGLVWGFTLLSGALAFSGVVLMLKAAFWGLSLVIPPLVSGTLGIPAVTGALSALSAIGLAGIAAGVGTLTLALGGLATLVLWFTHQPEVAAAMKGYSTANPTGGLGMAGRLGGIDTPGTGTNYANSRNWGPLRPGANPSFTDLNDSRWVGAKPPPKRSPVVRPGTVTPSSTGGDVYLDSKKVGRVMAAQLGSDLDRASRRGGGRYDPQQGLSPVGAGYQA